MKKRIALVVNTLSGGGAEKTASNLSRILSERYSIDIIVNDETLLKYPYCGRVFSLRMPPGRNIMETGYQMKALVRRTRLLRKLKKKRQYAAVLSFSEMTNLSNVLSRSGGTRTIISVHNSVENSRSAGWKKWIAVKYVFPFCFKRADKTAACSKEIADELIKDCCLAKDRSYVIYNGLDLEEIRNNARHPLPETMLRDDEKLIVTVGRLSRQKGQWHLIRAVKKLLDEDIPVRLVILGEGEMRQVLEKLTADEEIRKSVYMPGFVRNPHQYMARADVVVFPSLYEGFSNAIVEALGCGAPVISTDHKTGAREILAPGTDYRTKTTDHIVEAEYGLLVPVCDGKIRDAREPLTAEENLLAEAICRMITEPGLAEHYRQHALQRAEQLDLKHAAEKWIRTIEDC